MARENRTPQYETYEDEPSGSGLGTAGLAALLAAGAIALPTGRPIRAAVNKGLGGAPARFAEKYISPLGEKAASAMNLKGGVLDKAREAAKAAVAAQDTKRVGSPEDFGATLNNMLATGKGVGAYGKAVWDGAMSGLRTPLISAGAAMKAKSPYTSPVLTEVEYVQPSFGRGGTYSRVGEKPAVVATEVPSAIVAAAAKPTILPERADIFQALLDLEPAALEKRLRAIRGPNSVAEKAAIRSAITKIKANEKVYPRQDSPLLERYKDLPERERNARILVADMIQPKAKRLDKIFVNILRDAELG